MTIAFNCWILRNKNVDGIGNVVIETLRPMIAAHPEVKFQLLCDKNFTEDYFNFPNVEIHRIFPPYRHPLLYIFYLEIVMAAFLKKHRPDVFVGMDGMISLRTATKQIALIHDLNFEHYPQHLPFRNRVYYRYFFRRFAAKADKIVTISQYTKKDMIEVYKIDAKKIDVIILGAKEIFKPLADDDIQITKEKYAQGQPYFFFVGSLHARKNILRLMQAFDVFKKQNPCNVKLVLAGNILWEADEIKNIYQSLVHKNDIIFTGRVSDEELKQLLGAALALTFVPLFEGFGLPIVEAFQAGVPVICSNVTSMPEVAGDAALQVNPFDVNDIATAMKKIYNDENLRKSLVEKGQHRKEIFNWKNTAAQLFECIKNV